MMYRAFKHYVQNRFKWDDQTATACHHSMVVAVLLVVCGFDHVIDLISFYFPDSYESLVLMFSILISWGFLFAVALLLAAIFYALKFYGNYEVIERHFGYRAFRLNLEQQEYHALYYERFPKKQERIIASACLTQDGTIWAVLEPGRHHHCIAFMAQYGANKKTYTQGFLTDQYRYIGRQAARSLAMANGQSPNPDHTRDLFSEDLWDTPEHLQYKG